MKLIYALSATISILGIGGIIAHLTYAQSSNSRIASTIQTSTNIASSIDEKSELVARKPGGLFVQSPEGKQVFPLKHTEVKARITGNVSRVEVTQTFENPFKNPLEAIYVFPLPDEAAVDDMEIKIGDRIIKGDIKKREEAKEIYERARKEGRTAGLLEQERDNIFTQSLANIKPGEKIDVTIRYTDSLKFEKGSYEFVFPMVVGPRYIPGNPIDGGGGDTDTVPDASRINPPVLKPGTRSGHDIGVTVEIDAGVPVRRVWSTSHKLVLEKHGKITTAKLQNEDTIPNKDLILRYEVAGKQTQATVLTQSDEKGGHFAVYLIPAVEYRSNEIVPKDVVFLMDTSGSQSGDPLIKSKELMRRFINGLNPNDTFTIINFANTTEQLSTAPLANNAQNRAKAMAYIDKLDANGGTELLNGIQAVLNFPAAQSGRLRSVVLLTDGYIGNENEIIAEVQRQLKPGNRLYSFGVGSSVNRFLLNRLAEVGRGTSQVIRQDEPTQAVAEKFFRQINNPVLTNIQVSWEGAGAKPAIYPQVAPDLFANQPLVLFGRQQDRMNGILQIKGTVAGGKPYEQTLKVSFDGGGNSAIAQLWGRAKIKDLMNQMYGAETKSGVEAVTDTALAYRLLSQYTAFVAVSEEVRVNPDGRQERVQVPVELPQGVSYEGIFGNNQANMAMPAPASPSAQSGSSQMVVPRRKVAAGDVSLSAVDEAESFTAQPSQNVPRPNLSQASKPSKTTSSPIPSQIQVISANGLDSAAINSLSQYLQSLNLPSGVGAGDLVLEFTVSQGRVGRVVLDEKASTVKDAAAIALIKRKLIAWQVPKTVSGNIRLQLKISP